MTLQTNIVGSMSADELRAALVSFPRLSDVGRKAVGLVLVDGMGQSEVANKFKIHRQQVNKWCKDVFQAHKDIPKGWVIAEVTLPPALMDKVKIMEQKARQKLKKL